MAWYVGQDGQQLWIQRDENVYTVIQPASALPLENLSYLTQSSKKTVFQEHLVQEDSRDAKNVSKRQRERMAGKQRGFLVRVETEEGLKVVPWFKAATTQLIDSDIVSRVDADDAANIKKKKKNDKLALATKEPVVSNLGVNECRVETTARIHHFAHGAGFRVEVREGDVEQRIHFFTNKKEMQPKDWHALLVAAVESTGAHVMLARRIAKDAATGDAKDAKDAAGELEQIRTARKDNATKDDDAWLESVMLGGAEANGDKADSRDGGAEEAKEAPAPTPKEQARPKAKASASSAVPEWRRRDPEAPTVSKSQAKQQRTAFRPAIRQQPPPPRQQQQQQQQQPPAIPARPTGWWQVKGVVDTSAASSSTAAAYSSKHEEKNVAPVDCNANCGFFGNPKNDGYCSKCFNEKQQKVRDHQQQPEQAAPSRPTPQPPSRQAPQPPSRQAPPEQQGWWEGNESWWQAGKEQWWEEPSRSQHQAKPAPAAPPTSYTGKSINVRELFPTAREEEKDQNMGRDIRQMLTKCAECGRGKPLKLFVDTDDDQWYCRVCWVEFYGSEPPGKKR